MSDIEFINGLNFKAPNSGAPEYVKAKGSIKNGDLISYLQARVSAGEEWTNFDVKESKGGKYYAAVDNWKPEGKRQERKTEAATAGTDDDIPF